MLARLSFLVLGILVLLGCSSPSPATPTQPGVSVETHTPAAAVPAPTVRVLPTLYPTASPGPTVRPTQTRMPEPTDVPDTPIAFEQTVVELHYAIPGLGLDRTLKGNVASQIEVTDEIVGDSVARRNQAGVLLELQQVLPEVRLSELPESCELCVQLEYSMPLAGEEDSGWLEDVRLLASVENFTSAILGPHFPAQTVAGLRRSATPYQVAHTVAVTSDDEIWRWTATEAELEEPLPAGSVAPTLAAALEALELDSLDDSYDAACPSGAGIETLYLNAAGVERQIDLVCPELSLPAKLLPIYLQLDSLAADKLAGEGLPSPSPPLPIDGLLYFQVDDGSRMTLHQDGTVIAVDENGVTYTETLTNTRVLSLTTELTDSGALRSGTDAFARGASGNVVVVRGPDSFHEAVWDDPPAADLEPIVSRLTELLESLLGEVVEPSSEEPTATPSATSATTPEPTTTHGP